MNKIDKYIEAVEKNMEKGLRGFSLPSTSGESITLHECLKQILQKHRHILETK